MSENINSQIEKPQKRINILLVSVLLSIFFGMFFGFSAGLVSANSSVQDWFKQNIGLNNVVKNQANNIATGLSTTADANIIDEETRRVVAVEKAMPAVVSVIVSKDMPVYENYYSNPFGGSDFFSDFFGGSFGVPQMRQNGTERRDIGVGTGFFVSADGLIVTNKHVVVDEEADYTVITFDGEKHQAQVLGRDPSNDLAVLKIEGENYSSIPFATDEVKVGQGAIAIGYALGEFTNTVSTGIISGLSRDITAGDMMGNSEQLYDVIQTDAAINPGNSGGPLLNLNGEAVGVNVAVEQGAQGIGFALPIQDVKRVVESVVETGRIARPFFGIRYVMINEEMAKANQLPVDYGALVIRGDRQIDLAVMPGSPADVAGIVENDIILEIEDVVLTESNPLVRVVRNYKVGDIIKVKVLHKGKEEILSVTLVERE